MNRFFAAIIGVTLLTLGCAHSPDLAPSGAGPAPAVGLQTGQIVLVSAPGESPAQPPETPAAPSDEDFDDEYSDEIVEPAGPTIADPWEPFNRAMFEFNDRLYFWVLKPVAQGYSFVVHQDLRVCVSNAFDNLRAPIRFLNSLLQGNVLGALTELGRFTVNSIWGFAGMIDVAATEGMNLQRQDEDFGQTLGFYGMGHGIYIVWPFLGPASARDTVGMIGDYFAYPISYLDPWEVWLAVRGYEAINQVSLKIGDYEALKAAAIDPYIAIRDAYVQYRLNKVKEKGGTPPGGPVIRSTY